MKFIKSGYYYIPIELRVIIVVLLFGGELIRNIARINVVYLVNKYRIYSVD